MKLLTTITWFVFNTLYARGYTWARRGSVLLIIAHLIITATMLRLNPLALTVPVAATLLYHLVAGWFDLLMRSLILTAIPSTWMALTEALFEILSGHLDVFRVFLVFTRAWLYSIIVLYALHTLNLQELSYMVYKVTGRCSIALFPHLLYRCIASLLRDSWEAMHVHALKGEPIWKTLGVSTLRAYELAEQLEEGLYLKQYACKPRPCYSLKALVLQTLILLTDIITLITLT